MQEAKDNWKFREAVDFYEKLYLSVGLTFIAKLLLEKKIIKFTKH